MQQQRFLASRTDWVEKKKKYQQDWIDEIVPGILYRPLFSHLYNHLISFEKEQDPKFQMKR